MQRDPKALHLQQPVLADDAGADFSHIRAWHEQLCERIGQALASITARVAFESARAIVTCSTFTSLTRTADFEERKVQPIKRCYER